MRIPEGVIEEVRSKADIVEIAARYIRLVRSGTNYKGLCPFHTEKTPSFVISPEKQVYHCFGCGRGGNVFRLVMELENVSFVEAVKRIGEEVGVRVEGGGAELSAAEIRCREILAVNSKALELYEKARDTAGENVRKMLRKRGISLEEASQFKIGYAPKSGRYLSDIFTDKERSHALAAGLLRREGTRVSDFFRSRIIFPILDYRGRPVGFSGRVIVPGDQPKYINSPQNEVFDKSCNLYGIDIVNRKRHQLDEIIVVEGYTDVISLNRAGFFNAVASMGTALTSAQLQLLSRFTRKLILLFDADDAGISAAERGIEKAVAAGFSLKICVLPGSSDPDEFIRENGADRFREELERASDYIEFLFERAVSKADLSSISGKIGIVKSLEGLISRIPDGISRELYIREFSHRLNIDAAVWNATAKRGKVRTRVPDDKPEEVSMTVKEEVPPAERKLLETMLPGDSELYAFIERFLEPELFRSARAGRVYRKFVEAFRERGVVDPADLMNDPEMDECVGLLSELAIYEPDVSVNRFESALYLMRLIIDQRITQKIEELKLKARSLTPGSSEEERLIQEFTRLKDLRKEVLNRLENAYGEVMT